MCNYVLLPVSMLTFPIAELGEFMFDILEHRKTGRQTPDPQIQIIRHDFAIRLQHEGAVVQLRKHFQTS